MTLGQYPEITLAAARQLRADIKYYLANGDDPRKVKKADERQQLLESNNTIVTIRNAVSEVLFKLHGNQWPWNNGFINTLPNPKYGDNPRRNLQQASTKSSDVNKVIPELNFVFWQKMFTSRHDDQLWLPYFRTVFPNANANIAVKALRGEMYNDLERIRKLRNRIAHHEPVFSRKLDEDYQAIIKIIGYRCKDTAEWLSLDQSVGSMLSKKP